MSAPDPDQEDHEYTCVYEVQVWATTAAEAASIAESIVADRIRDARHWVVTNDSLGGVPEPINLDEHCEGGRHVAGCDCAVVEHGYHDERHDDCPLCK